MHFTALQSTFAPLAGKLLCLKPVEQIYAKNFQEETALRLIMYLIKHKCILTIDSDMIYVHDRMIWFPQRTTGPVPVMHIVKVKLTDHQSYSLTLTIRTRKWRVKQGFFIGDTSHFLLFASHSTMRNSAPYARVMRIDYRGNRATETAIARCLVGANGWGVI